MFVQGSLAGSARLSAERPALDRRFWVRRSAAGHVAFRGLAVNPCSHV